MPVTRVRKTGYAVVCSAAMAALAACGHDYTDTRVDHGIDHKPLSDLQAQVWTDPEGCDHWIIDDGLEGYMTPRRHPDGKPVCRAEAIPERIYNLVE